MRFNKQEQLVLIFIIVTVLIGSGVLLIRQFRPSWFMGKPDFIAGESKNSVSIDKLPEEIIVHVTGEVRRPAVYQLEKGMRVADAIQLAGGATEKADLQQLNLASRAIDGEKIYVPAKLTTSSPPQSTPEPQAHVFKEPLKSKATHANPPGKINLNTATVEELESLPGIGPVMAKRIIEYRNIHGPFYNIEEIKEIKGIGEKTYEKIKALIAIY
ncbi:MAG: helix-hairpin-helix domain-containing protein [Candidatus Poribacteria bacterium]